MATTITTTDNKVINTLNDVGKVYLTDDIIEPHPDVTIEFGDINGDSEVVMVAVTRSDGRVVVIQVYDTCGMLDDTLADVEIYPSVEADAPVWSVPIRVGESGSSPFITPTGGE